MHAKWCHVGASQVESIPQKNNMYTTDFAKFYSHSKGLGSVRPKPDGRMNKNRTAEYYDRTAEKIENQTAEFIYPVYQDMLTLVLGLHVLWFIRPSGFGLTDQFAAKLSLLVKFFIGEVPTKDWKSFRQRLKLQSFNLGKSQPRIKIRLVVCYSFSSRRVFL